MPIDSKAKGNSLLDPGGVEIHRVWRSREMLMTHGAVVLLRKTSKAGWKSEIGARPGIEFLGSEDLLTLGLSLSDSVALVEYSDPARIDAMNSSSSIVNVI